MAEQADRWLEELMRLNDEETSMTEKQLRIVQAAVDIFAEKGFAATSTSEIAQKAGVAEGTIFRHYKTKKDLLLSIVGPIMAKTVAPMILKDFNKVLETPYSRYEDFLRAVAKNRLEYARKNIKLIQIMFHEIPFHPELREQFQSLFVENIYKRFTKVVEHFQKQGQLLEQPPYVIIRHTISVIVGFVVSVTLLQPATELDDAAEMDRVIDLIMLGLAPRSS
jgi:AcrR family transcriptional regulator